MKPKERTEDGFENGDFTRAVGRFGNESYIARMKAALLKGLFVRTIPVLSDKLAAIDNYLNGEEELGEDETISFTAKFEEGIEMDIKVCGTNDGSAAWTEAVLFKNGSEICHTDVCNSITGKWELEYNGNTYTVNVVEGGAL